jgi:hypothetical protein
MNGFVKLIIIVAIAYIMHMMLRAVGMDMGLYITYLIWFVVLGIFLVALPDSLPNILKPDPKKENE